MLQPVDGRVGVKLSVVAQIGDMIGKANQKLVHLDSSTKPPVALAKACSMVKLVRSERNIQPCLTSIEIWNGS